MPVRHALMTTQTETSQRLAAGARMSWTSCVPPVLALLLLALPASGQTQITTVGALATALAGQPSEMPLAVAVGRGFKAAPLNAAVACMTPDQRSQWWDRHQDASCTDVLLLTETTRTEATPPSKPATPEAQGERCVVRAEFLEPDGSAAIDNTHPGQLLPWQCEALAAAQAVKGFRRELGGRVYFYPPQRILRLEILPLRASE